MLAREGTSRWELGRDKFLERAWDWKEKYGHMITDQPVSYTHLDVYKRQM